MKRGSEIKMSKIYPVLLAGGSGSRLWPLSRKSYPKQFSELVGEKTLFQQSAMRLTTSDEIEFASHIIMTNADFRFIVGEQLRKVFIDPGSILIEPEAKNTGPAILAASLFALQNDPDAILIVAPSDHIMPDQDHLHHAIKIGLSYVEKGKLVTFGIKPTHPETGYGYLELSETLIDSSGTAELKSFVEKPVLFRAKEMLTAGNYLWNAGIFLFRATDMIDAFRLYAPKTEELVVRAFNEATKDLEFLRLEPDIWSMIQDVSIDYAIMEKATNLVAVPYNAKWSDLGDWNAVMSEGISDPDGNVISDAAHAIDCKNSLIRSESENQQIVAIGLENIMAISMPDAVLVACRNRSQEVKNAVDILKTQSISQAETFPKDHRPWGWFESLAMGDGFQVKRICVLPGAALSLQSHNHRSEHWVVVQGIAKVTIGETIKIVQAGESVFVPLKAKHRMENLGEEDMILIEVQIGAYLGEDDIVRYSDMYNR